MAIEHGPGAPRIQLWGLSPYNSLRSGGCSDRWDEVLKGRLDSGPPEEQNMRRDKNVRCCLVCRRAGPKESFWRVVRLHPTREISLDDGMGRSAYICQTPACVKQARKKGRLGKALRSQVRDDIYAALEARLNQEITPPPMALTSQDLSTGQPDRPGE